jgi:hypothetical protein
MAPPQIAKSPTDAKAQPVTSWLRESNVEQPVSTMAPPVTETAKATTATAKAPPEADESYNTARQNLTKAITNLSADEKALQSNPKDTKKLAQLKTDEQTLHNDILTGLKGASSNFADFSQPLQAAHSELKSIATGLWKMGLKSEASDTTAYFPLSNYKHEFGDGGKGKGPGDPPPPPPPPGGATEYALNGPEHVNSIAKQIGGSGDFQSASATYSGNTEHLLVTGGSDDDVCFMQGVKTSQTDNPGTIQHVTMEEGFSFTQSSLNNLHEYENDLPTGAPKGCADASEMMATQINVHTGQLDIGGPDGGWGVKDAGNLGGPIVAGKEYQLEIGMTIDQATHTATMDSYDINGVNLLKAPITFKDIPLGWGAGDFCQTQLDLKKGCANGTTVGVTEYDKRLYVSDQSSNGSATPS